MSNLLLISLLGLTGGAVAGIAIGVAVVGLIAGFFVAKLLSKKGESTAKNSAAKIIEQAYSEAKQIKKEAQIELKEEILKSKTELDSEIKDRKQEVQRLEDRMIQRESFLDKKEETIDKKQENLDAAKEALTIKEAQIDKIKAEAEEKKNEIVEKLSQISGLTKEEAKAQIILECELEAKKDAAKIMREIEQQAKDEGNKKAKEIITLAIQKCAADHTQEVTVSVVPIPSDDVKGRIIGREGRNIRALEQATGVELIIDDTPEAITLSGFDPVRREIARIALEKLILDGRIHPARIEEIVEKTSRDMEQTIKEAGENAAYEAGIHNLHPELVKTIGRLKYRTSYGQNCLNHSLEVSYIAGLMAAELGANVNVAKRGGFLHDIGKAVDHEFEGTHVTIGVDLAKKYKESDAVIHCIEAHHGGVEYKSIEAILVQAADAISSARPGARRESLENYIKRLQNLEAIASGFNGVEKAFAIQAGREVRIIVKPDQIDDSTSIVLAHDIAKKIEGEMDYPGQIKVNVIRETRAVDYAK